MQRRNLADPLTNFYKKSWNEVTLIFGRSMQRRNLANPLTKPFGIKEFDNYQRKMGIRYPTDWL